MTIMPEPLLPPPAAAHVAHVFPAGDLYVTWGANLGDGMAEPEHLCAGDTYTLDAASEPLRLALAQSGDGARDQRIAGGSQLGEEGDPVQITARLTLMAPDGQTVELLLLRHTPRTGVAPELYVLPLNPLVARTEYTLIRAEQPPEALRLSDMICLSFLRGTRIMLASGRQTPIQELRPGDRVLTRDHGPQPIRWIGHTTLRARGAFAPVVISAGALGNEGDLIVGPHHRIFQYLRDQVGGSGTAETLIQARHLVDDENIYRREGGFADYFSLVFDQHEIIYAEGIPVESLMVNEASLASLPQPLAEAVRNELPGMSQDQHFGIEADPSASASIRRQRFSR